MLAQLRDDLLADGVLTHQLARLIDQRSSRSYSAGSSHRSSIYITSCNISNTIHLDVALSTLCPEYSRYVANTRFPRLLFAGRCQRCQVCEAYHITTPGLRAHSSRLHAAPGARSDEICAPVSPRPMHSDGCYSSVVLPCCCE
eukprot:scaffold39962_cov23-Prasinocladus_malaysianus.AAC.1